jgi:hypothetical protein
MALFIVLGLLHAASSASHRPADRVEMFENGIDFRPFLGTKILKGPISPLHMVQIAAVHEEAHRHCIFQTHAVVALYKTAVIEIDLRFFP